MSKRKRSSGNRKRQLSRRKQATGSEKPVPESNRLSAQFIEKDTKPIGGSLFGSYGFLLTSLVVLGVTLASLYVGKEAVLHSLSRMLNVIKFEAKN